jgi:predicted transposase YdaD
MSTKPYDQAFKFLAEHDAEALLLLLGDMHPGQQAHIQVLPREVSISAQLPDQPYEVTTDGERRLVHVEAQTAYDANLPEGMLEYAVRLWLKYRLPITSYALLLTDRKVPRELPETATLSSGNLDISLRYAPVCLWQLSARSALEFNRASLLPFVPLMKGAPEDLELGARRLAEVSEASEQQELSLHFLLLGGLRYNREDLLELLGRKSMIPIEQLKESSFYQYILEEGRQEGHQAGHQAGVRDTLRLLLEQRFGALPDWAAKKIEGASEETLEKWSARLLSAASLEDALAS